MGKAALLTLNASLFAFDPVMKWIDNGGSPDNVELIAYRSTSTTLARIAVVNLNASSGILATPGVTISLTRVDSSPPWDIGDGEIPFFIFVEIDSNGRPIYISSSANPPWDMYNLAENIVKRKMTDKELSDTYGINSSDLGMGRKYSLKRSLIDRESGTFEDTVIEVGKSFKNKHMSENASPFKYNKIFRKEGGEVSSSGNTIVLIDPCETIALLELYKGGYSINDFILNGDLEIANTPIVGRLSPHEDIKIVPLKWKKTRAI